LFNKGPGLGLDIGSNKVRLVKLKRKGDKLKIEKYGSISTPPGVIEAGNIYDPERLGTKLGELVSSLKLKGKPVVTAVSGQQVYLRNLVLPKMKLKNLQKAALFEATTFLPIPVDEAIMDIYPIKNVDTEEGKKTELFFVAVRRAQVDNLVAACRLAGLKPVAVEIEPLALRRILSRVYSNNTQAYLQLGASHSYISVFKGEVLAFQRYLSISCAAFFQNKVLNGDNQNKPELFGPNNMMNDISNQYIISTFANEIGRVVEQYNAQAGDEQVQQLILCGGGTRIPGLDKALSEETGYEICVADIKQILKYTRKLQKIMSAEENEQLAHEFIIALGLAAREVI